MFLALAALMFQIPQITMIPKAFSLSAGPRAAEISSLANAEPTAALPAYAAPAPAAAAPAEPSVEPLAQPLPSPASEAQPEAPVAYMPGRVVPEPFRATNAATDPVAMRANQRDTPRAAAEDRNAKRLWLGLSIAEHSAATFDAWSTRRVISSGAGQELDPVLRPFAGNASLYLAVQLAPAVLDYVGRRMMTSDHAWARRTWWIPQTVSTVLSVASGVHNMGVYNQR